MRKTFEERSHAELADDLQVIAFQSAQIEDLTWACDVIFHQKYRLHAAGADNARVVQFMATALEISGDLAKRISDKLNEVL